MRKHHVLVLPVLLLAACTAPTLQQRQDAWVRYRDVTRATCLIGAEVGSPDHLRIMEYHRNAPGDE